MDVEIRDRIVSSLESTTKLHYGMGAEMVPTTVTALFDDGHDAHGMVVPEGLDPHSAEMFEALGMALIGLMVHKPDVLLIVNDGYMSTAPKGTTLEEVEELPKPSEDPKATECLVVNLIEMDKHMESWMLPYRRDDAGEVSFDEVQVNEIDPENTHGRIMEWLVPLMRRAVEIDDVPFSWEEIREVMGSKGFLVSP